MSKSRVWYFCVSTATILSILTFTPLVIPKGEFEPSVLGIPYTLWTGILIAFALVFLTWVAGRFHPESDQERADTDKQI